MAWPSNKQGSEKVAEVSKSGTQAEVLSDEGAPLTEAQEIQVVELSKWYRWRKDGTALVKYLLDSEVHTFAFSVAANAILSFIPFIYLLYTLSRVVFHSTKVMAGVLDDIARDFLPSSQTPRFWEHFFNDPHHGGVQAFSLLMILVACTGIFLPLEVALNQAWGVVKSRNYLMNQVVAFGLAILMVVLGMSCVLLNTAFRAVENWILPNGFTLLGIDLTGDLSYLVLMLTTGVASIVFFFTVYWLLPNRKVPPKTVIRTAIITGSVWLVARYLFAMVLPHLYLIDLYGFFNVSVGIIFWAYTSGLILFAGAQFSVSKLGIEVKE
jgi:YihY family inner membrane protein